MDSSAAALFKDGELVAAVEEERLTRIKNDNSFPHRAIEEVLEISDIKLSDISKVAVYWQPWRIFIRSIGASKKLLTSSSSRINISKRIREVFVSSQDSISGSWSDLFFIRRLLQEKHGKFDGKIYFYDHHTTHQRYGELIKNWENFISLSYDGGGESDSTVLSVIINGRKKIIKKHKWPNSLGHFYSTFTGYLGFKMLEGEYKMMGLAPYGKPVFKEIILSEILVLKNNGMYNLNTNLCDYHSALQGDFHEKLSSLFGPKRFADEKPTQEHINLATSVQSAFETCLQHILSPVLKNYPDIRKLVITGGCALNVTANGKLISNKVVDEVIIPPAPHDAGCAIGAGLCAVKNKIDLDSIRTPYLGRSFSKDTIFSDLSQYIFSDPIKYSEEKLIEKTVDFLIEGKLIAWFQGKSEFGPRALGARSFLADPRNDKIGDQINQKIKKRELFRPFAPSIIEEAIGTFFEMNQISPYMNIVAKVKTDNIPAVTHVDGTSRVHTVKKEINKRYYELIKRFGERTGVPVLLNTSFNIQEPIVYSPKDAINTFINSGVDMLVIEDYIIKREDLKN